ncbi:hypothetical protein VP01_5183g1 [Puccinia sorghi]|uniref:Uncharacterized protein n=1 Tax=Puccinia sorghi TaxID=27349 RepID=A0A0L6UKT1_9BASI|nr:hypothetical protein VP01_5183g1 [Puccinia sorghi]
MSMLRGGVHRPTPASSNAPTTNPNAMDLSAFQHGPHNRLSDTKRARQLNLCFCCVARPPAIFVFSLDL